MNEDRRAAIMAALTRPGGSIDAARAAVPHIGEWDLIDAIRTEALRRIDSASAERMKALLRGFVEDGWSDNRWPDERNLSVVRALDPSPELAG